MNKRHLYLLAFIALAAGTAVSCLPSTSGEKHKECVFTCLDHNTTNLQVNFQVDEEIAIKDNVGVGVGDFNKDGLPDVILIGKSSNDIYLNTGGFRFEKHVEFKQPDAWSRYLTATVADLNHDGWDDLLMSCINFRDSTSFLEVRMNLQDGAFGQPERYMVYSDGFQLPHTVTLLDFNEDGSLDIYLSRWKFESDGPLISSLTHGGGSGEGYQPGVLFMNDGQGGFSQSKDYRGLSFPFPHFASWATRSFDVNNDGRQDLYVGNDFNLPDYLLINGADGFRDASGQLFGQTSYFSMGADVADMNNDGYLDLVTTDMRRRGNYRQKTSIYDIPFDWQVINATSGYDLGKQQVKNTLNINMGGAGFSEVGEIAGVDATEWTWGVLAQDFDNDGHKDLFFANGYILDYRFLFDYPLVIDSLRKVPADRHEEVISRLRQTGLVENRYYRNRGNLTFEDLTGSACDCQPSFTAGVAVADFDRDGRSDIITVNVEGYPVIYRNMAAPDHHYLDVSLHHETHRTTFSAHVEVYHGGRYQLMEMQPVRGIYSTSERTVHFGLGADSLVDSLVITWPDRKQTVILDVVADQTLEVTYRASEVRPFSVAEDPPALLEQTEVRGLQYVHEENDYNDFAQNMLLPKMYSRQGPQTTQGDLDNNGLADLVIGGASGTATAIFLQQPDGSFHRKTSTGLETDRDHEDGALLILDYDGDGHQDLLITEGGNEHASESEQYAIRLYRNNGKAGFTRAAILPEVSLSGAVAAATFTELGNGGTYVFLGARLMPWDYPLTPRSYLLALENGILRDVTEEKAPGLSSVGMVTDAAWTDFDGDGKTDLIVVGEYMAPTFFRNQNGKLTNFTASAGIGDAMNGFWNCITPGDLNNDGRMDYVLGNLGMNTRFKASPEFPLEIFGADVDDNGYIDVITAFYDEGELYPVKPLHTLKMRIDGFAKKYYRYEMFGRATVFDMFGKEKLEAGFRAKVHTTRSVWLENMGEGQFAVRELPYWAQVSPVNDVVVTDLDTDGAQDIVIIGNFYYSEVERGRYTSQLGLVLKGDGQGAFQELLPQQSGFLAGRDCRSMELLATRSHPLVVVTRNNDTMLVYRIPGADLP